MSATSVREVAEAAKRASRSLASRDEAKRNRVLEAMASSLERSATELLAANQQDMQSATSGSSDDALPASTLSRLKLTEAKLHEMVEQVRSVAALPDPLNRQLDAVELDDADPYTSHSRGMAKSGLHLEKRSVPLGVLAVIFEARPDAVTQIASLAIKSGNAVILKPGREVENTARAIVGVLRTALASEGIPEDAISLVLGRESVAELLAMHDLVDMVIPRGSKSLVEYVQANTRIPVLGHSEGICHIYVDRAADQELSLRVIDDAKLDYPAACNAVETVLVHRDIAQQFLPKLLTHLRTREVVVHGDDQVRRLNTKCSQSQRGIVSMASRRSQWESSTRSMQQSSTFTGTAPHTRNQSSPRMLLPQKDSCKRLMLRVSFIMSPRGLLTAFATASVLRLELVPVSCMRAVQSDSMG